MYKKKTSKTKVHSLIKKTKLKAVIYFFESSFAKAKVRLGLKQAFGQPCAGGPGLFENASYGYVPRPSSKTYPPWALERAPVWRHEWSRMVTDGHAWSSAVVVNGHAWSRMVMRGHELVTRGHAWPYMVIHHHT